MYSVQIFLVFQMNIEKSCLLRGPEILQNGDYKLSRSEREILWLVFFGRSSVRMSHKMYEVKTAHHRGQERGKGSVWCGMAVHMGTHASRGTYEMQSVRLTYT